MKLLEQKIVESGSVLAGNVLKVDNFLNHQIDTSLMREMGKEIARLFKDDHVTKVLTIEASGIAIAIATSMELDVPMVFAKKSQTKNLSCDVYSTPVYSYTHATTYDVRVCKNYLNADDRVLIVDDFLANGAAFMGLVDLVEQSGATLCGGAIAIEKAFQDGGKTIREKGIKLCSLAKIESMDEKTGIIFSQD